MDKKQEKSIAAVLIVLVFVVAFAVTYTIYSRTSSEYIYGGVTADFDFILDKHTGNEVHILQYEKLFGYFWQKYLIPFEYGPEELEDIPIEKVRWDIRDAKNIYITRDVYLDLENENKMIVALLTVERVVGQKMLDPAPFNIPTLLASIEDNERTRELKLPVLTCNNANENRFVIWFKEGNENQIYKGNDYCVVAEFESGDNPIKIGTALTYHIMGVL
jgi:hypothetical protein